MVVIVVVMVMVIATIMMMVVVMVIKILSHDLRLFFSYIGKSSRILFAQNLLGIRNGIKQLGK